MDTLNFGEIMEREECWYEEYDLTCPYCHGEGERKCQACDGEETGECLACEGSGQIAGQQCSNCGGAGYLICDDCDGSGTTVCEECSDGRFEVMWNTAFEVKVWDDFRDVDRSSAEWKEAYKLAWDLGFCLIEHGQQRYLLMGMCGQDCTWIIQYTRWKLQGFLHEDDCQRCIGSGGYVFLRDKERHELCAYIRSRLTPPESYAQGYKRDIAKIDRIAAETA